MKKNILGIKIDDITMNEALEKVQGWLSKGGKYYIVTPNPEILVMANKDPEYRKVLNDADLSIPDGVGLKIAGDIVCILPGIDFMEELIRRGEDYGFTIGLLGGKDGVAKKASECLRKKYPKSRIVYTDSGGVIDEKGEWVEGNRPSFPQIDLLFVGFGPPKQEFWISKNLENIPVKVAMGVGGALDYLSGKVLRAPGLLRNLGLEWLFRLAVQPWRIKRQLALFKYLLLIWKEW